MPFLPPIAASTMLNKVVGTNPKAMPLIYIAATKPVISETTPPPTPTIKVCLLALNTNNWSMIFSTVAQHLLASPEGMRIYGLASNKEACFSKTHASIR